MPSLGSIRSLTDMVRFVEMSCAAESTLFRGQPLDAPLLPKIARKEFVPRGDRLRAERELLADFSRQAPPHLEIQPSNDWDWLAIAQHHGLPTRLLDWTLNPLAALWFTVRNPIDSGHGVVWMFEVEDGDYIEPATHVDPLRIGRTRVFRPRHLTRRIVAQSGWFTAHKFIDERGKFISLETNKAFKSRLTKLIVPRSGFNVIRRELDRCGVNGAALLGGADGLASHLKWLHSLLPDEMTPLGRGN